MGQRTRRATRAGASLIELLIVMAIIGIMVGLLMPALHMVLMESRKTGCDNNIHQLALAMQQYYEITRGCIPASPVENYPSGWAVAILPFMEDAALAKDLDPNKLMTSPQNLKAAYHRPRIFICPVTSELPSTVDGIEVTDYVLFTDMKDRHQAVRNRYWNFRDAPAGSRFPWCSSPEFKWPEEAYPPPHTSAFGL